MCFRDLFLAWARLTMQHGYSLRSPFGAALRALRRCNASCRLLVLFIDAELHDLEGVSVLLIKSGNYFVFPIPIEPGS